MQASDPVIRAILAPLAAHYGSPGVIELRMSQTRGVMLEYRDGRKEALEDPRLTLGAIEHICKARGNYYQLGFDADHSPNLSCVLPGGHRFACLVGSSVQGGLSLAIRVKQPYAASPDDFGLDDECAGLIFDRVREGRHIIISGGTNTGKTTFLNMLLQSLPASTRVIAAEDTPEVNIGKFHPDCVGLIAARSADVAGMLPWPGLADHVNRITPDRVIFGEISVRNAMSALAVLNSGISGFMCTIHAANPVMAIRYKFAQNLDMAGTPMLAIVEYLTQMVDLVIQIDRLDSTRKVSAVYDVPTDTYLFGGRE